jgi:hypothetical protein
MVLLNYEEPLLKKLSFTHKSHNAVGALDRFANAPYKIPGDMGKE